MAKGPGRISYPLMKNHMHAIRGSISRLFRTWQAFTRRGMKRRDEKDYAVYNTMSNCLDMIKNA